MQHNLRSAMDERNSLRLENERLKRELEQANLRYVDVVIELMAETYSKIDGVDRYTLHA